ncbi:MAG: NAD(P)H-dependent oxidoreductase [Deltaproteobacteria bacterium]|nr:NAD(P)H-dependent oxidoreductase [Deltaproteobacteria bacterium]
MNDTSAQRLLVLFAHPALEKSRVNRRLAASVDAVPGVTFHDLYEAYPDFHIRADREQELLTAHDVFVFQFPFFWYSTPAMLKEWQDIVLEHGWAYGSEGNALKGKTALFVVSTGASEEAYQVDGFNRHTMRQFLASLYQTCSLCGIACLPPFVVHGTHSMSPRAIEEHAADYQRVLEALRDGRIDVGDPGVAQLSRLNENLDALLAETEEGLGEAEEGDSHAR